MEVHHSCPLAPVFGGEGEGAPFHRADSKTSPTRKRGLRVHQKFSPRLRVGLVIVNRFPVPRTLSACDFFAPGLVPVV